MNERPPITNIENQEVSLLKRISNLRNDVLTSHDLLSQWSEELYVWDKSFKENLAEKWGTTQYAQQVPEWQTLVGGTPEEETDITDEIRSYILQEVENFVSSFEDKL